MAAVHVHLGDEADEVPFLFRQAVEALRAARVRPEIRIEEVAAPRRLASYAYALEATVRTGDDEPADGRLVLLHEPDGQDAWHGVFRLVTLASAELEPEMAGDPLLPEVSWSWLTGSLSAHRASYHDPSGTVSRASSHYFGGLSDRADDARIEIRASWTPRERPGGAGPDLSAHLSGWCDLLCACAGLPPSEDPEQQARGAGGVLPLPKRRG
ncbi:DUF3000 domain-containing protein [Actinacidiphila sp. DG2A-62]|uniref:DUF3000 domain-containing protein n=1 Tax=Actinacidiphila sp. DG2A-62 TaxID=3108821 RepID=UPI002DB9DC5D|nr:DUF3000 domain-containing protein [Actinacidiphila sp. DG2A-62]MEC3997696.1 DUF3000 domain-containing protein [Actinacidiphila sp. DG2A-62]